MSASSKRRATSDLNHDNWDRETEPETAGTFQTASENELKNRVIRKARRKLADDKPGETTDSATKSVFSGFTGFGKTSSTSSTSSTLSAFSSNDSTKIPEDTSKTVSNTFSFLTKFTSNTSTTSPSSSEVKTDTTKKAFSSFGKDDNAPIAEKSKEYYAKLKGLNQAVSDWIKSHVDKDPLCILTPIFKDYEKFLAEIDKNESSSSTSQPQVISSFKFQTASSSSPTSNIFSFGKKTTDTTDSSTTEPKKPSIFGSSTGSSEEKPKPAATGFSFGLKTDTSSTPSIFSAPQNTLFTFGGSKPFTFANVQPPPAADKPADDKENGAVGGDDDEDEPPKVEFKAVVEEDSIFSQRCKVFVKNDGNFADRGVGTLYLKPVKDSKKVQLLVRADTNLGNILVNLILNDSIPTQRMGKNNVMLVCIPTPETEKPTPMLLRVKTSEEADELLTIIDKHKKSN